MGRERLEMQVAMEAAVGAFRREAAGVRILNGCDTAARLAELRGQFGRLASLVAEVRAELERWPPSKGT